MNRKLANEELGRPDIESYKKENKNQVIAILDNVRSLNNIGSVFRTADAFAIEAVYLCGITAQPPHREINKTALGATDSVQWIHFEHTIDAVKKLQKEGWKVYSIEQAEKSTMLNDFKPELNDKVALVFGHEVKGVDQEVINLSEGVIEIPQKGTKHSLNISVSAGLVMWEVVNKLNGI
jgi:tRNA G18 (ribose-2'-O)-methylase SpoU